MAISARELANAFSWTVPAGEPRQRFLITLLDRQGSERARASLQTGAAAPRDAAFRFPPLVQAGKPLPIRGPLDGDFRTTRVEIAGSAVSPLAESVRRVIVRAPSNLIGPTPATLTEAGIEHRGAMRSLSIEMAAPASGASPATRELTVRGASGIDRDVPLLVAGDRLYLRATDVAGQPTFTVRREFSGVRADSEAQLVIPQSLREEVAVVLRTPQWSRDVDVARQHGDALNALDFDALPVAEELLSDSALGRAAVFAMLAADERRALSLILASMPDSGVDVQFLGLPVVPRPPSRCAAGERRGAGGRAARARQRHVDGHRAAGRVRRGRDRQRPGHPHARTAVRQREVGRRAV